MSQEPPVPPAYLPTDIINTLNDYPQGQLQEVARYTEQLAEHKARNDSTEAESEADDLGDGAEDLPDEVPSKATITIKEINENRYYYWQWRDGETVKSKYKAPVNPSE